MPGFPWERNSKLSCIAYDDFVIFLTFVIHRSPSLYTMLLHSSQSRRSDFHLPLCFILCLKGRTETYRQFLWYCKNLGIHRNWACSKPHISFKVRSVNKLFQRPYTFINKTIFYRNKFKAFRWLTVTVTEWFGAHKWDLSLSANQEYRKINLWSAETYCIEATQRKSILC